MDRPSERFSRPFRLLTVPAKRVNIPSASYWLRRDELTENTAGRFGRHRGRIPLQEHSSTVFLVNYWTASPFGRALSSSRARTLTRFEVVSSFDELLYSQVPLGNLSVSSRAVPKGLVHASPVQPSTNETQAMPARNRSQAPSRHGLLTVAHPRIIVTQTLRSLFCHVPLTVPANRAKLPSTSSLGAMSKERKLRGGSVTVPCELLLRL